MAISKATPGRRQSAINRLANGLIKLLPLSLQAWIPGLPNRRQRPFDPLRIWRRFFPEHTAQELYRPQPAEIAAPAPSRPGWLRRMLFPRVLTPEEKAEQAALKIQRRAENKRKAALISSARDHAREISHTLENMGLCHKRTYMGSNGRERVDVDRVKFCRPYKIELGGGAVYLRIDTHWSKFPHGLNLEDLITPEVQRRLSHACGHSVSVSQTERETWYCIELETGAGGLPRHVRFADMLATRPANLSASAARYAYPLGMGRHARSIWRNFRTEPHLLISGSTGGGKSTFINSIICTLIGANTPGQLQLIFIDLKGGMELSQYMDIPHIARAPRLELAIERRRAAAENPDDGDDTDTALDNLTDGAPEAKKRDLLIKKKIVAIGDRSALYPAFTSDVEDVPGLLWWVYEETEKRQRLFAKSKARDIAKYNSRAFMVGALQLPEIFILFDEIAVAANDKLLGPTCGEIMAKIINRGRATGVHCIMATQTPTSDVLGAQITNAVVRVTFGMSNQYVSQSVIGTQGAFRMEKLPGRAIFSHGNMQYEVQCPYLTDELMAEFIRAATAGETVKLGQQSHDVSDREILEWALENETGNLISSRIWDAFRGRGLSARQAEAFCRRVEGQTFDLGGQLYRVMPGVGRFPMQQPRRLLPVSDEQVKEVLNA